MSVLLQGLVLSGVSFWWVLGGKVVDCGQLRVSGQKSGIQMCDPVIVHVPFIHLSNHVEGTTPRGKVSVCYGSCVVMV